MKYLWSGVFECLSAENIDWEKRERERESARARVCSNRFSNWIFDSQFYFNYEGEAYTGSESTVFQQVKLNQSWFAKRLQLTKVFY